MQEFNSVTNTCFYSFCVFTTLLAHLSDIRMFYSRYLTMHKVHMYAGATRQLLYGCAYVREIIYSLKFVDYLPVHTHKPYNNLHLTTSCRLQP